MILYGEQIDTYKIEGKTYNVSAVQKFGRIEIIVSGPRSTGRFDPIISPVKKYTPTTKEILRFGVMMLEIRLRNNLSKLCGMQKQPRQPR